MNKQRDASANGVRPKSDAAFLSSMVALGGFYVVLVVLLITGDVCYTTPRELWQAFGVPEIRYSLLLSIVSSTITTILALWVAVPLGYLLSRWQMEQTDGSRDIMSGRGLRTPRRRRLLHVAFVVVDTMIDIPLVLPPLVVGVSLLVLFSYPPLNVVSDWVVYEVPAVIIAQFTVATAFAVRTMRTTFDQIPVRQEQVAMTLGASRSQVFWTVLLPQARRGAVAAATLSWARAIGEFGPVLIFAGSISMRTEVLPTTIYLKMEEGNLTAALSVSVVMILCAMIVLVIMRLVGWRRIV
jgi:molybdate transport system permease protein